MDELYDEFGNYLGGDLSDSESDDSGADAPAAEPAAAEADEPMDEAPAPAPEAGPGADAGAIVLAEDKQVYPDASEVFPGAQVLVEDEDTQHISEPIIAPVRVRNFSALQEAGGAAPEPAYQPEFLVGLLDHPALMRNVALVGALHHGKSTLCDLLMRATHPGVRADRYTDTRQDEQSLGVSVKSTPLTLLLESSRGKSYVVAAVDTPGHVNFSDEVSAALAAVDGVLLVVDCAEGVSMQTERVVREAAGAGLPIVLALTKLDRLILELKLPPADAYFKLQHTIREVNALRRQVDAGAKLLTPLDGSVVFAAATHGWSFSLATFAAAFYPSAPASMAKRLWGDRYFNAEARRFVSRPARPGQARAAVEFVLEPLYKIYSCAVGEDPSALASTLAEVGVYLERAQLEQDARPLLRDIFRQLLGQPAGVVDALVAHCPTPRDGAAARAASLYSGEELPESVRQCDSQGPLVAHVVKQYSLSDGSGFVALARVYSGALRAGDSVRVLGPRYRPGVDEEDFVEAEVEAVSIPHARYSTDVPRAPAGSLVLVHGVCESIGKTATLASAQQTAVFHPLQLTTLATVRVSVEPLNPAELPKLVSGLRCVSKSYPLVRTHVEDSGEHVVLATGELAMDCVLRDVRERYGQLEVRVSDPVVPFRETVSEVSKIKCFAESPNGLNSLTMIAEPLDEGLAEEIESGAAAADDWRRFQQRYGWDLLAARSVWTFGDHPNALLNDTLADGEEAAVLEEARAAVAHGFTWASREGPLCSEPMRGVKVKLLDAVLAPRRADRGRSHLIPAARRTTYSAFLTAAPRLYEPVFDVEVVCPADCVRGLYNVFSRRRGHLRGDEPIAGTPLFRAHGHLPVIDSYGFETDLRAFTQGAAFCQQVFSHWTIVPGDPLDKSIELHPLEPSPHDALAREFMLKTRRRKGLSDTVSITQYFSDPRVLEMAAADEELEALL